MIISRVSIPICFFQSLRESINCYFIQVTSENGSSIKYCGAIAPHNGTWIDMRSSVISVEFHSDLSIEKTGYKLYYRIKRKNLLRIFHQFGLLLLDQLFSTWGRNQSRRKGPSYPWPGRPRSKRGPQIWLIIFAIACRHQNWTHQELISHISPFNIHIYLIRQRNWSSFTRPITS